MVETSLGAPALDHRHVHNNSPFCRLNFHHENVMWEDINTALKEIDWHQLMDNLSPVSIYELLYEKLIRVCEKNVPVRTDKKRKNIIPKDRKVLMRKRTKLVKQMKLSIDINWKRKLANKMQSIEKQLILSHENERKYAEMKAVEAVKRNPKFFYKYVKEKAKIRSPIGPLKLDGELVDDTERICAALRSQYDSVFSKPISYDVLCDTELDEVHHDMTDVNFTEKNIAEAVAELACGAAADDTRLLKKYQMKAIAD
ncbi:hypothetical protein Pcinc_017835 [Petrolisthes cinctipes]|uniref:Uncharacterized protein n=1 Tax=Petrolisthes cinctipes TaxID=88211 RepID=A0AAE1FNJ2_PETCI|nr:hypothetical protein Pcinc_017835 [Petrolisthes cinctipes]